MTKKRFKKLLMSFGYSRNAAEAAAKNVQREGHQYCVDFFMIYLPNDVKKKFARAIMAFAETLKELSEMDEFGTDDFIRIAADKLATAECEAEDE